MLSKREKVGALRSSSIAKPPAADATSSVMSTHSGAPSDEASNVAILASGRVTAPRYGLVSTWPMRSS